MIKYFMNFFITGASGFVGIHLINLLQSEKKVKRVYVLIRSPEKLKKRLINYDKVNIIEGDLFNIKEIPADTNYIIHLAGLTKTYKKENYYFINRDGVKIIAEKSLNLKNLKKFILISSLAAQGPSLDCKPAENNCEPSPVSHYGKSKLEEERELLKHIDKLNILILRPPAVYGEWDLDFLEEFKLVKKGISLNIKYKPAQRFLSLVNVKDLVRAIFYFAEKETENGEKLCITEQKVYSWEEIEEIIANHLKTKIKLKITLPLWFGKIIAFVLTLLSMITKKGYIFNSDKIHEIKYSCWICSGKKAEEYGFSTKFNFDNSLNQIIDWYKRKELL